MRELRKAYDEGKDGMFIWEEDDEVVGWSWLRLHENEFFRARARGVKTIRVETAASTRAQNKKAS